MSAVHTQPNVLVMLNQGLRVSVPIVLDLLDQGLSVYRRELGRFVLVSSTLLVALDMLATLLMALARSELGNGSVWRVFSVLVVPVLGYGALLYTMAALSRTADAVLDGRPVVLNQVLRLSPARVCGMAVFNALFTVLVMLASGILGGSVVGLLYILAYFGMVGAWEMGRGRLPSPFTPAFVPVSALSWLLLLGIIGVWLMCMVYALQAFVLERRGWRQSAGRAFDIVFAHFGRSLLLFGGAGLLFGTLAVAYTGSLAALLALIRQYASFGLPMLARDSIVVVLICGALALLLPPLAIWNVLFFRSVTADRDGDALEQRLAAWRVGLPTGAQP